MNFGAGALLLFLIPLSGYVVLANLTVAKAMPFRMDGQQLFYRAAAWGVLPTVIGMTMMMLASGFALHQAWIDRIGLAIAELPARIMVLGVWMMISGFCVAMVLNVWLWVRHTFSVRRVLQSILREHSTDVIRLLMDAFERDQLILVTLKSRKVYCGSLLEWPVHARREVLHLCLLPLFSSWRDKDTLVMGRRTEYPIHEYRVLQKRVASLRNRRQHGADAESMTAMDQEIHKLDTLIQTMDQALGKPIEPRDWLKVIPLEQIESISLYDPAANAAWFPTQSAPATPAPPTHLEPSA